ncbi:DedA family protein [Paractinoplanes lichenicola]|uniref:DedA family protein n=1 Tax=Paractinoplanes lichenicola TaxID=2802976 RepID=UPI0027DAD40E|nr:DedA family protein [Actinoplanes lichenicola]
MGVFAAGGEPNLALVMTVAAIGAFCGDHIAYRIGRTVRRDRFRWVERPLEKRGGLLLVVARYIPGGRTAVTMTMGAVRYPPRKFALFDALAAMSWAVYSATVGYVGGEAFEHDKLKGLLLGLGLAAGTTVIVEAVRYGLRRRAGNREESRVP